MSEQPKQNTRVFSRDNILSLYLPTATLALGQGIAVPAIPEYAKSFGVGVAEAALVFFVYQVASVVATVPTGIMIDRFGRRRIALAGPILVAVSSLMVAFAHSFPELLVYRFIGGYAQQMWQLGRLAIIADTGGDRQRGRQITGMIGMDMTGKLLGPAVGGYIAYFFGVNMPFVAHAVLSLLAVIPSFKMLKETAPHLIKGKDGAKKVQAEPQTWGAAFAALMSLPVLMFFLAQFLASLTRGTQSSGAIHLFPAYAYGSSPAIIGTIASGAAIVGIPIVFSTGTIMDKFGRKWTVVPGFFLLSFALTGMAWVAWAHLPIEGYIVSFVCMQAALNVTSGNMQVIGSDIAPAHVRGKFFGIWRMIGEFGTAISPVGFALLAEGLGYEYSFALLAASSFACAAVLLVFVPDPVKKYKAQQAAEAAAAARAVPEVAAAPAGVPVVAATTSGAAQPTPGSP